MKDSWLCNAQQKSLALKIDSFRSMKLNRLRLRLSMYNLFSVDTVWLYLANYKSN